jgi:hypothetical protein
MAVWKRMLLQAVLSIQLVIGCEIQNMTVEKKMVLAEALFVRITLSWQVLRILKFEKRLLTATAA